MCEAVCPHTFLSHVQKLNFPIRSTSTNFRKLAVAPPRRSSFVISFFFTEILISTRFKRRPTRRA